MKQLSPLQQTAQACGIQTSFIDSSGVERFASPETLRVLLDRLGVCENQALPPFEPVIVHWQGSRTPLRTRAQRKPRKIELQLGDGGPRVPIRDFEFATVRDGELRLRIPPRELPTGYHELIFSSNSGEERSLLISAPRKLYAERSRQWGAFLPLYAAHSRQSWGAGNLTDWKRLATWLGEVGGAVVGTLPILSAFLDYPKCEPSPYSPASRLFWNEFFIDVTAIPEFQTSRAAQKLVASASFQKDLQQFQRERLIDYSKQWAARRKVLQILAREFVSLPSARRADFERYLQNRPEVKAYADFRATCDKTKKPWQVWKENQGGDSTGRDFYIFVQWIAQQQIDDVLASCGRAGVKFYLDLPLGVNPDGFDAWRYRNFFADKVSAGAPPDAFFTKGQDWGFAPLDPRRTRELHYKYVIDYLRFQMQHTGLLRIDHVMGLHRLWWVPHGHPASEGAYVRYRADEFYAILSVESHRHKTTLVGENLGTVPPEVNQSMDRHGLRRMFVLQYEQPAQGPLREPEAPVAASVNTHDMPMFGAHWKGLDIADRHDLGLIPTREIAAQKRQRAALHENLVQFLRSRKLLKTTSRHSAEVLDAILKFLSHSPAETILVNLEDLWGETASQNVPGTSSERPNWRRKARLSLEEILNDQKLAARLRAILHR